MRHRKSVSAVTKSIRLQLTTLEAVQQLVP
jgi:hypothetical protein